MLPLPPFLSNIFYASFSDLFYNTIVRFIQLWNIFITAPGAGVVYGTKIFPFPHSGYIWPTPGRS